MMLQMIPMDLEEVKKAALTAGFQKIRPLDAPGISPSDIRPWRGVASFFDSSVPGSVHMGLVTYYLDGDRIIVKKALSKDVVYILS